MFDVAVQQTADHFLIRDLRTRGVALKEVHAMLTERNRDLDPVVTQNQLFRRRQEITNDFELAQGFIALPGFLFINPSTSAPVAGANDPNHRIAVRKTDSKNGARYIAETIKAGLIAAMC